VRNHILGDYFFQNVGDTRVHVPGAVVGHQVDLIVKE
jgi:hypothetical protein